MFYSIFWHACRFWVVGVNAHSRLPTQKTDINRFAWQEHIFLRFVADHLPTDPSPYLKERPLDLWQKRSLFLHSSTKTRLSKDSMAKQSSTPKKPETRSRSRVTRARSSVKSPSPTSSGVSESLDCYSLHSVAKPSKKSVRRLWSILISQFLKHPSRCSILLIPCAFG